MRAVVVTPPVPGARLADVPAPDRPPGSVRVAVRAVGVCGTDRDIVQGRYGRPPPGRADLVIGHENLGQVVASDPGDAQWPVGRWVVASVRRGCGRCRCCLAGRVDLCTSGGFVERGISGADGYAAEQYVERPEFLHAIPDRLAPVAVLLEPLTVVQKALRVLREVQSARLPSGRAPGGDRALVAGSGAIGMLAAATLRVRGAEVTVVDRHPGPTPADAILRAIGARHTTLDALGPPSEDGAFDTVLEATGASDLPIRLAERLAPNGALALTGIPDPSAPMLPVPVGAWARGVVLGNRLIVGSVNAAPVDFEQGVRDLAALERHWPGWLAGLLTDRRPWTEAPEVLETRGSGEIKTVLAVGADGAASSGKA